MFFMSNVKRQLIILVKASLQKEFNSDAVNSNLTENTFSAMLQGTLEEDTEDKPLEKQCRCYYIIISML